MADKRQGSHFPESSCSRSSLSGQFPIIGIGASAGGLESLKKLFSTPVDGLGMAYIIVIHMMPDRPSLMPEILGNQVSVPVGMLKNGDTIKPDHIYIAPAGMSVSLDGHRAGVAKAPRTRPTGQIDTFLDSLAREQKENAVAVILSGTGSDGTIGIQTVKGYNGLVIVESEASAKYDGMPASAIGSGLADMVLDAGQIMKRLTQYFCADCDGLSGGVEDAEHDKSIWLNRIYSILEAKVGHNFADYKTNTILRRISRRMSVAQVNSPKEYLELLMNAPEEVGLLFNDLLIGVTSFFRDPESFEAFRQKALLDSFKTKGDGATYRIWVPGCSTGEEVYSLAILLKECMDEVGARINLQIFGTDIDRTAIEQARGAVYPDTIEDEVGPERLKRFFQKEGSVYKIRKEIRDCAIFSLQDLIKDPPFSRLDLVCCRNLLIYLTPKAQRNILPLFHYTLNADGNLILGSSETIGTFDNLFSVVDNKWKIFRKRQIPRSLIHHVDFPSGTAGKRPGMSGPAETVKRPAPNLVTLAQQLILEHYAPTSVLVDEKGTILYVQGRTGRYLETTSGAPSINILDLAREGLRIELSSALREATGSGDMVVRSNVAVKTDGGYHTVDLKVSRIHRPRELSGRLLVVFEEIRSVPGAGDETGSIPPGGAEEEISRIRSIEKELQDTRESHQVTLEELESSNEELKSTNEELQSSNEELQSTNEELESSKEELQSLNEELQTVNSELQSKVDELSGAHDDMRNLLNSTEIATVFVDNHINVKRFTRESSKLINLIQTDAGRPLKHVVHNLDDDDFISDIERVIQDLSTLEREVRTKDGQWYNMRIMPYRTTDNRIDGAVITFVDIDGQKSAARKMENAWQLTRNVFDLNKNPLAVMDFHGIVIIANTEFSLLIGSSPGIVEGTSLLDTRIINPKALRRILDGLKIEDGTKACRSFELTAGGSSYAVRTQELSRNPGTESFILLECLKI